MAGTIIADKIQTENSFLTLNVGASNIATMNSSGIYSPTGVKMIGTDGTVSATLSANTLANSSFQTGSIENYLNASGGSLTGRNKIINGAMAIDQRNAGSAITVGGFPVDRFSTPFSNDGAFSAQQDSSAPAGFTTSVKCTTTTADASLSANQYWFFRQRIEGYNVADLGFGAANAKTITLSFWVRSSLTGTFSGAILNGDTNRSYPYTYTISAADTWEKKTITIPGDTSGTWLKTNGNGMVVAWSLGIGSTYQGTANAWGGAEYYGTSGSVSVIGTLNATWYVTGVQLEAGSTPTPFEYRNFGTELALCQRYYYKIIKGDGNSRVLSGYNISTTQAIYVLNMPISMRTSPTALETNGTAAHYSVAHVNTETNCNAVPSYNDSTINTVSVIGPVASGLTAGQGCQLRFLNATSYLAVSAEL